MCCVDQGDGNGGSIDDKDDWNRIIEHLLRNESRVTGFSSPRMCCQLFNYFIFYVSHLSYGGRHCNHCADVNCDVLNRAKEYTAELLRRSILEFAVGHLRYVAENHPVMALAAPSLRSAHASEPKFMQSVLITAPAPCHGMHEHNFKYTQAKAIAYLVTNYMALMPPFKQPDSEYGHGDKYSVPEHVKFEDLVGIELNLVHFTSSLPSGSAQVRNI
jgi:hypothetical protein